MPWHALRGIDWTLGVEPLPWGTRVRYHHLVAVVRGKAGPSKESIPPPIEMKDGWWIDPYKGESWVGWRPDYKGLWIWPEDGEAIVLGTRRKMIGYIDEGGYNAYHGESDPTQFNQLATVPLLVLSMKDSLSIAYAPFWAVESGEDLS
jgi:hypothetical protein